MERVVFLGEMMAWGQDRIDPDLVNITLAGYEWDELCQYADGEISFDDLFDRLQSRLEMYRKKLKPRPTRLDLCRLQPGQQLASGGIHFERLANGDGRYAVNIMVDRVRIHRIVGLESEGVTLTQAEQFIEQLRTEARASRLNLPKGRKVALGFSRAADDYLKRLDAGQGRNMSKKRLHIARHLKPFFADKSLSRIEKFDLQRHARQRRGSGAAPGTINREFATLLHLYKRAVE